MAFEYAKAVTDAEAKYDIPDGIYERLLSKGEHSGPTAWSPVHSNGGYYGTAQLGAAAAQDMGVDRFDPLQNIMGGAHYLRTMYDRFGDWDSAVAHYNAGPGGNLNNHETREYVKRVMGHDMPGTAAATGTSPSSGLIDPATDAMLTRQGAAAFKSAESASAAETQQISEAGKHISRVAEEMDKDSQVPYPIPPRLKALPPPPDPKEYQKDPTRVLGETLPMLAILGSLTMRNGALGALKASAAAMKAAKANDQEALQKAHDQWKDTTEQMLRQYDAEQQQFTDIMEDRRLSQQERLGELQAWAAMTGNAQTMAAVKEGDFNRVYQMRQMLEASAARVHSVLNETARVDIERQNAATAERRASDEALYHKGWLEMQAGKPETMSQYVATLEARKLAAHGDPKKWSKDEQAALDDAKAILEKNPFAGGTGGAGDADTDVDPAAAAAAAAAGHQHPAAAAPAANAIPLPADYQTHPEKLVNGKLYATPSNGSLYWDAKRKLFTDKNPGG